MSNQAKGTTTVKLDGGDELTFQLNFSARMMVESETERSFAEVARRADAGWQTDVLILMWAALHKHHDFSKDEVAELLDDHAAEMVDAMIKAAKAAEPDAKAGNGGNRKNRRASKTSGSSGAKQD